MEVVLHIPTKSGKSRVVMQRLARRFCVLSVERPYLNLLEGRQRLWKDGKNRGEEDQR